MMRSIRDSMLREVPLGVPLILRPKHHVEAVPQGSVVNDHVRLAFCRAIDTLLLPLLAACMSVGETPRSLRWNSEMKVRAIGLRRCRIDLKV